jgi:hypothetical protein
MGKWPNGMGEKSFDADKHGIWTTGHIVKTCTTNFGA